MSEGLITGTKRNVTKSSKAIGIESNELIATDVGEDLIDSVEAAVGVESGESFGILSETDPPGSVRRRPQTTSGGKIHPHRFERRVRSRGAIPALWVGLQSGRELPETARAFQRLVLFDLRKGGGAARRGCMRPSISSGASVSAWSATDIAVSGPSKLERWQTSWPRPKAPLLHVAAAEGWRIRRRNSGPRLV